MILSIRKLKWSDNSYNSTHSTSQYVLQTYLVGIVVDVGLDAELDAIESHANTIFLSDYMMQ